MLIVKVGGGEVDLDAIARDLATLEGPLVVLHGANRLRDDLAQRLGHPPQVVESISGYTSVLSDDTAIDVMMAAYAGIRNKRLVEALRRCGVNALGLTGLDGGVVRGTQNRGIRVRRDGRKLLLRDQSGKAAGVNTSLLHRLLDDGYVPVLTVPIAGEDGSALNSENDDVLTVLAGALGATEIVSLMDEVGLLADPDDPSTLVRDVAADELASWEGRVSGRMRRKIRALRALFDEAPDPGPLVRLSDGRVEAPVSAARQGAGTLVRGGGDVSAEAPSGRWNEPGAAREVDVYGSRGLTVVEATGAEVVDASGRRFLDCVGGNGALALGHRHPVLQRALGEQMERVWCVPGAFTSPPRVRFLERLHATLPEELDRTFLSNSGTEAVEAALKFARQHTGRSGFVGAERGFHGRTMGALSVTASPRYRAPFEPLLEEVRRVPFGDAAALDAAVDGTVAAVVLEPVQGEGGVHPADPGFLRAARALCDERGALLVFDEVQTGFGRTGRLFAFEHSGVVPDLLCLAKSIAGGLPLGATVVRRGIEPGVGTHGSTFGGNPLACAVARATLDVLLDEGALARAEPVGRWICDPVRAAEPRVVREIRQIGAMVGIELRVRARPFVDRLHERGILALTAGRSVLRLLPPLVMTEGQARHVGETLASVLAEHGAQE
jgi:acetylornithine/LysW-gamma-L-lysine aminotransferase